MRRKILPAPRSPPTTGNFWSWPLQCDAAAFIQTISGGETSGCFTLPLFACTSILHCIRRKELHRVVIETGLCLGSGAYKLVLLSDISYLRYYIYYFSLVYGLAGSQLIYTGFGWGGSAPFSSWAKEVTPSCPSMVIEDLMETELY